MVIISRAVLVNSVHDLRLDLMFSGDLMEWAHCKMNRNAALVRLRHTSCNKVCHYYKS